MSDENKKKRVIDDKNDDVWKPYLEASPEERKGWLTPNQGEAPRDVEEEAKARGEVLRWINVKDDTCRNMAFNPQSGPPWLPVARTVATHEAYQARPGVDGHSDGTSVTMGGELQLARMPKVLYDELQAAIQRETDARSMGLGGEHAGAIEAAGGEALEDLYTVDRKRRGRGK